MLSKLAQLPTNEQTIDGARRVATAVAFLTMAALSGCGDSGGSNQALSLATQSAAPPSSRYKLTITPTSIRKKLPKRTSVAAAVTRREILEEHYDNGQLRRKHCVNILEYGQPIDDGDSTEYHENGTVYRTGQYKNGKRIGEWTFNHACGNLAKRGSYQNGKPDGQWIVYARDGLKTRIENFVEGKPDGKWTKFYPDERVEAVTVYRNGGVDGKTIQYTVDGSIEATIEFVDRKPEGVAKRFFPGGECQSLEHYQKGQRHGRFATWDEAGMIVTDEFYQDGLKLERIDWPADQTDVERPQTP